MLVETTEGAAEVKTLETILNKVQVSVERRPVGDREKHLFLRNVWGRYSSPRKGLRVMALVHLAIESLLRLQTREVQHREAFPQALADLQSRRDEIEAEALRFCLRGEQEWFLAEVRAKISAGQELPRRYACWRLFTDGDGLTRINGRLAASRTVPFEARNPIFSNQGNAVGTGTDVDGA